jgi:hypothetical protein
MHIRGTDRIKGALDLASIGVQLSNGSVHHITESDLQDAQVQIALRMGYIITEGGGSKTKQSIEQEQKTSKRMVRCLNKYNRSLALKELSREIPPNGEFEIKERDLLRGHIKDAISKGMIQVLEIIGSDSVMNETFVKMGDLFERHQSKEMPEKEQEAEIFAQSLALSLLDTNEELKMKPKVIDTETPKPIKSKDIDDPKHASVVWNPANNPVINEMKNANVHKVEQDIDKVLFVDKEQEQERVESHPNLEKKDIQQNSEVDLIE